MRKITVLFFTVMLVVGITGLTQAAKKAKPDPLAAITGLSCEMTDDGGGPKFQAKWSWAPIELTPPQTKFGGDAVFEVNVTLDGEGPVPVGLEIEIVKFDTELIDLDGKMSYYCDESNVCTGDAYPVTDDFIIEALDNMFLEAEVIEFERIGFGDEVWVKAMDPGVFSTPQNYPKENVCPLVD